jgi:hypothetical protein
MEAAHHAIRSPWRLPAAACLLVNAGIHVDLAPMHLQEAPYIGVLFILLSLACIILAATLLVFDAAPVWLAAGAVSLLGLAAFVVSRTIGLPQIEDDMGNWTDPLGWATMVVECLAVLLAAVVVSGPRHAGSEVENHVVAGL